MTGAVGIISNSALTVGAQSAPLTFNNNGTNLAPPCFAEGVRVRYPGEDRLILASSGEGATSEGEFWESINQACLNRLPVLFLIQDNGYAISVPVEHQTPGGSISASRCRS